MLDLSVQLPPPKKNKKDKSPDERSVVYDLRVPAETDAGERRRGRECRRSIPPIVCVCPLSSLCPSLFFFFFLCVRFLFFGKISCKKKLTLSDCFDSPPPPHREDPNGGEGDTPSFYKYLSTILLLRRQEQEMERKRQGWIDDVTIGCDRRRCALLFPPSRLDFDPQIS
jgi:hypothetical protein